jgi:hypothetical protein
LFGHVASTGLLACPKVMHFGKVILPPEWRHILFTFGITNPSLYKRCPDLPKQGPRQKPYQTSGISPAALDIVGEKVITPTIAKGETSEH